jgi:hypothetical protein
MSIIPVCLAHRLTREKGVSARAGGAGAIAEATAMP